MRDVPHRTATWSLVLVLLTPACDDGPADPEGAGGAAASSSASVADASAESTATGASCGEELGLPACPPCGSEIGGAPCSIGARCDPAHDGCTDAGAAYCAGHQRGGSCAPVDDPRCIAIPLECTPSSPTLGCVCPGVPGVAECAEQTVGVASSPELCATDRRFACGATTCREWLEVCVAPQGGDEHCEAAASRGCSEFGLADCNCLEVDDPDDCTVVGERGDIRIVVLL